MAFVCVRERGEPELAERRNVTEEPRKTGEQGVRPGSEQSGEGEGPGRGRRPRTGSRRQAQAGGALPGGGCVRLGVAALPWGRGPPIPGS